MVKQNEPGHVAQVVTYLTCDLEVVGLQWNFFSGDSSPHTSDVCKKSSQWLWKEKLCHYWCEEARKHIDVSLTALIQHKLL